MKIKRCPFCGGRPTAPFFYEFEAKWFLRCFGTAAHPHSLIEFEEFLHGDGDTKAKGRTRLIAMWNGRI